LSGRWQLGGGLRWLELLCEVVERAREACTQRVGYEAAPRRGKAVTLEFVSSFIICEIKIDNTSHTTLLKEKIIGQGFYFVNYGLILSSGCLRCGARVDFSLALATPPGVGEGGWGQLAEAKLEG
jgi:hypothetical protein